MKQQCHNTVPAIKFRIAVLMESSGKGASLNVKPRTAVKRGFDSHGRHIHSSQRKGRVWRRKDKAYLTYPSNPSSEEKCSKFKD